MRTKQAVVLFLLPLLVAGTASAHDIGGSRFDAPIPLTFLFVGGGLTVALTAGLLTHTTEPNTMDSKRGIYSIGTLPSSIVTAIRVSARTLFLLAFIGVLVAGLFGRQVATENFATVFVWPIWLKGVALLALLIGNPWSVLSPWRTIYAGLCQLEGGAVSILDSYPRWLSEWPALVGFLLGVGIIENLTVIPRSPQQTALLVSVYALVMLGGGITYGAEWFRRADLFAVLYRLFGSVSPITVTRTTAGDTQISLRYPWRRCTEPVDELAIIAFIIAMVYTVSFDGFTNTPEFQTLLFGVRDLTGLGPAVSAVLYFIGYGGFLGVFWLVAVLSHRAGFTTDALATAQILAPTVLPIAAAYEFAHNYPFVVQSLGQLITLGGRAIHLTITVTPLEWLSLPVFWASQVVVIVIGHIFAVVAAHILFDEYTTQQIGYTQLPLTTLMVAYTMLSLWIISRPIVS